jgi:CubicO group peptidase (beta-lactamase class C family)
MPRPAAAPASRGVRARESGDPCARRWRPGRWARAGVVAALVAGSLAVATQVGHAEPECTTAPAAEYPRGSAAEAGLDPERLRAALTYASLQGSSTVKVFRHGCLVGEGLRDPLQERVPTLQAGQTKTVVALVAGIVADRGWVDLDSPIDAYLPPGLGDAAHRAVTLRQFLQLTSGVQVNHVQGLNFFADNSRAREYLAQELVHEPGTYFEFDETTPSVVVDVVQRVIDAREPGLDFQDFAQRELFDPLGIPRSAYFWQKDRSGTTTGYSGLWLRPLEYGRFGELLRGEGVFAGERILSASYVDQMRTGSVANCGFGLYVWLNSCEPGQTQVNTDYPSRREHPGEPWIASAPRDMYYSLALGTNTFVIPSLDMVVTRSGEQELDAVPGALSTGGWRADGGGPGWVGPDVHGAFPGNAGGPGEHEFFRLLMAAVTDLPDDVRADLDTGPYDRARSGDVDVEPFVEPPTAGAGSYLGVGPQAPVGCTAAACADEPNDGLTWVGDVPRTVPGIAGTDSRPGG